MHVDIIYQLGEGKTLLAGLPYGRLPPVHCEFCDQRAGGPASFPLVPGSSFEGVLDYERDPDELPKPISWAAFKKLCAARPLSLPQKGELPPFSALGPFQVEEEEDTGAIDSATDLISVSPGNPLLQKSLIEALRNEGFSLDAQNLSLNLRRVEVVEFGMIQAPALRVLHARTLQENRRTQCRECGAIQVIDYRIGVPPTLYLDKRFRDLSVNMFQIVGMEGGIYLDATVAGIISRLAPKLPLVPRGRWI